MANVSVALIFLCLYVAGLQAQERIEINEVVVEGKESKKASQIEKSSIQDIQFLSRQDVRHVGSKGVGEILKRLPGIIVQGPPMAYRNVKINGLDKEYQTILIDGHRPAGGEDRRDFKLDRLPATVVESVEVIYNPSVKYGGSSPAGVINIKTKDVPDDRQINMDIGFDHSNTKTGIFPDASLSFGDSKGKIAYLIYAGRYQYKRSDSTFLNDNANDIHGHHTEISNLSLSTASLRINYKANFRNTLKFKVLWSDQGQSENLDASVNRRTRGGLNYRQDSSHDDTNRKLLMLGINHDVNLTNWTGESSIRWDWSGMSKAKNGMREQNQDWETSLELEEQQLQWLDMKSDWTRSVTTYKTWKNTIKTGISASYNSRDFNRQAYAKIVSHKFWDEFEDGSYLLDESIAALYFTDEISKGENILSPGLRVEQHYRNFSTADTAGQESTLSWLPAISGKHALWNESVVFRWSVSRQNALQPFLYMIPVLKVKHKKEIIEKGNPNLLPAKSWNYNVSLQKYFGDQSSIKLRMFYTDIRDVVEMRYLGIDDRFHYRVFQAMNVDTAMIYGASLAYLADLKDFSNINLRIWGSVSLNGSKVRDPGSGVLRRLNGQPVHQLSLNADYLYSPLRLRLAIGYTLVGKRETFSTIDPAGTNIPGLYYEPYGQFDCSAKLYFSRWGYLSLSFHNMFDQREILHQQDVVEVLFPGRLTRLGLSLTF